MGLFIYITLPRCPKGQACEGVDNGGTVLAGSGPQGSNSAVLARGTNIAPWDLLPLPGCGLVLPARSSTALDFTLMRTHGALRLFPTRIFLSSSVTATRPTAPNSHGQNSSTPAPLPPAAPIGMPYPLQLEFLFYSHDNGAEWSLTPTTVGCSWPLARLNAPSGAGCSLTGNEMETVLFFLGVLMHLAVRGAP